jgi:HlyD family secretion protein
MSGIKTLLRKLGLPLLGIGLATGIVLTLMPGKPFETQGLIQAEEVKLASTQGGRVKAIYATEGQTVTSGQPLIQFEDDVLQNKLADAQNTVKQAQLTYQQLTQTANIRDVQLAQARLQQAYQQKKLLLDGPQADTLSQAKAKQAELASQLVLAQQELRQAQAQVDAEILAATSLDPLKAKVTNLKNSLASAQASVSVIQAGARPEQRAIAQAELAAAQAQLSKLKDGARPLDIKLALTNVEKAQIAANTVANLLADLTLKAPSNGIIGVISAHTGELIQPGKPIVTLVKLDESWVDIYIPEKLLPKMALNQLLPLKSPTFPDKTFQGKITFISPKSEFIPASGSGGDAQESATFRIKLLLQSNEQHVLRPGMKVSVVVP